ncbi:MAG TPA: DUF2950 domain-containing protein [Stellaceae bacterium]|nr:DUF2950 domain-containing protein [Stellaceae bacterium]
MTRRNAESMNAMIRSATVGLLEALRLGVTGIALMAMAASAAMAAAPRQSSFATPAAAVDALIAANRHGGLGELLAILGPAGGKLIRSGDPVADAGGRARFLAAYDDAHKIEFEGRDRALLIVGKENWPMPIPLVREHGGWRFDTEAGATEILDRRIGHNELGVIEVCRAYVVAQREYAARRARSGAPVEYAGHFMSRGGQKNGLYWPVKPGEEESPLGPLIARARAAGYTPGVPHGKPRPYYEYYFRIVTRQGKDAPGGIRNYLVHGHLTGGFALLAYPATYGDSGIMTFLVNQDGIVYEKNLGRLTASIAGRIMQYDPDTSWRVSRP